MDHVDIKNLRNIHPNGIISFESDKLVDLLLMGYDIDNLYVSPSEDIELYNRTAKFNSTKKEYDQIHLKELKEVDEIKIGNKNEWFFPEEYKSMDIKSYVLSLANSKLEEERIKEEFHIFEKYNLIDSIIMMKYIVDILIKENIVYGVGRGSSVASLVLFKLRVHRINPLDYDIDFSEFLS